MSSSQLSVSTSGLNTTPLATDESAVLDEAAVQVATPTASSPSSTSSESSTSDGEFPQFDFRSRGQSPSSLHNAKHGSPTITIDAVAADPFRRTKSASASIPSRFNNDIANDLRGRSLSPAFKKARVPSPAPSAGLDASWWGLQEKSSLPWKDQPKRKHTIPAKEVEGYDHTKRRVALAARSCLGNVVDVGHELLAIGVDLLELVPIPGLGPAAKTLLNIWDAVEGVEVNFHGCLRLTERCADLLISIREEVRLAGDTVEQELHGPISKLEDSFGNVLEFMQKQLRRPFLKRFLKRDEIVRDINECDAGLRDALNMFSLSVQIRILKQVQEIERQRRKDTQTILNTFISNSISTPPQTKKRLSPISLSLEDDIPPTFQPEQTDQTEGIIHFITTSNALGLSEIADLPSDNILPALISLQESQNSLDLTNDLSDLRQLMLRAIQTSSDAEIVDILQVKHEQMPDAIKALQRALENVVEKRGSQSPIDIVPPGIVIGKVKRQFSVKGIITGGGLQRSKTVVSIESTSTSTASAAETSSGGSGSRRTRDTLEQEFIENGISALVRMSQGRNTNLPSWTITKYEVNREKRIGVGGFSDVYRGTWKGQIVAIKVLKLETEKKLFIREIEIWKTLHHPHVLELFGASSATEPPWFLVSPYQKHGSLVDYLKKVSRQLQDRSDGGIASRYFLLDRSTTPKKPATIPLPLRNRNGGLTPPGRESSLGPATPKPPLKETFKIRREWDLLRFMHEIAKGMEYLHSRGVLHGDMKAANVLVDDCYHCVITDFGQSEIKSTAFRLTGKQPARGTLRWQAPELLRGDGELTRAVDVYAFAVACVEITNMGRLPWGSLLEDETIRNMVLKENSRPSMIEDYRFNIPELKEILRLSWHSDPGQRPSFTHIAGDLKNLQKKFEHDVVDTPQSSMPPLPEEQPPSSPSPDMRPGPLPPLSPIGPNVDLLGWASITHREATVATDTIKMPEAVVFTSAQPPSINHDDEDFVTDLGLSELDTYTRATLTDPHTAAVLHERRYRLLLTHGFHQSLLLPLWHPSAISLGAVGYLKKPEGEFITLFNAMSPQNSEDPRTKNFPSIWGYGKVEEGTQTRDRRTVAQKGWDSLAGLLSRNKNGHKQGDIPISRRYTYPVHAGRVSTHLCTQTTEYKYMQKLTAATKWFKANIKGIMQAYPDIQREEFCLVIGLLRTPNYGLFISHDHPDGHIHFNVYKSTKVGQPWGTFTTDTIGQREVGPSYEDLDPNSARPRIQASKVSNHGGPWDTVLISRLRFRTDEEEPTWKL